MGNQTSGVDSRMLISLKITNFAIVKELELDFFKGMTAFTGETGAGKSIMIDALMLALGGRGDASQIRLSEEKCEVTAVFTFDKGSEPDIWLCNHDMEAEGEVVLRRQLYREGRSKSTINGQPFPLQKIRELAERLVHIHGQHQHQTLMQHPTHRLQLDAFANHCQLQQNVHEHYKHCQQIQTEIASLDQNENHFDKIAFYEFQLEELEALNLYEGEVEKLNQELKRLHHAKDYLEDSCSALGKLSENEDKTVFSLLNQVSNHLNRLPTDSSLLKNAQELLQAAFIHCSEARDALQQFQDKLELDPERLYAVETRLGILHQAARKYHVDIKQLLEFMEKIKKKHAALKNMDSKLSLLQQDYEKAFKAYERAALALRESRRFHSEKMALEISAIIKQLGMPKGQIRLAITPLESMQAHGLDKIEYQVCTNPGTPFDALHKIASGGELSRISLAIQMITAQRDATPTLIFDEVDVGIGGATAALVGQLLRKLGKRLQVFCVTHQPQVAAKAESHFVVEKYIEEGQTYSRIIALEFEEKVHEIARMLSGLSITEQTRLHARELINETEI